jgi:hypothetical protein
MKLMRLGTLSTAASATPTRRGGAACFGVCCVQPVRSAVKRHAAGKSLSIRVCFTPQERQKTYRQPLEIGFFLQKKLFFPFRMMLFRIFLYLCVDNKPNLINKTMKELVEKINAEFEVFAANAAAQVEKNNKAAGTRARKSALEISKLMKEFRKVSVEAAK